MLHGDEGNYPSLNLKAHSGKIFTMYLAKCLGDMASRAPHAQNAELKLASMAADSILPWFHLQETAPKRFVSGPQAEQITAAGYSFLRIYQALARNASSMGIFRWKVLPKHHVPQLAIQILVLLLYKTLEFDVKHSDPHSLVVRILTSLGYGPLDGRLQRPVREHKRLSLLHGRGYYRAVEEVM